MGLEATCTARLNGESLGEGKAHCGDLELTFRGEKRVKFLFREISEANGSTGVLTVQKYDSILELDLGDKAEKWAYAIRNPKTVIDKFGLKQDHRYTIVGAIPHSLEDDFQARAGEKSHAPCDVAFVGMAAIQDLSLLDQVRSQINKDGMVWVIYPKGQKHFKESDIRGYARESGWVDVKIASVDDVLTSVKLVIPKQLR
ncbi:MAG TPA: hypothetical protein VK171_13225 [Fimbriimonas sp.]|nr:hypothetical protein [Fimbriimonas sp.]